MKDYRALCREGIWKMTKFKQAGSRVLTTMEVMQLDEMIAALQEAEKHDNCEEIFHATCRKAMEITSRQMMRVRKARANDRKQNMEFRPPRKRF